MKRSDVAQLLLRIANLKITLHGWQRRFIDDESRFRILLKHRGAGATFTIAVEAVTNAFILPSSTTILMSYSMRQSMEIFRHVKTFLTNLNGKTINHEGVIHRIRCRIGERTAYTADGSRIITLPNNPETLRGYRADAVYLDEAALFRDEFATKSAVMFTTVARQGRVTLVSTPKGKRGWFWEAWNSDGQWSKHLVKLGDSPHVSESDLNGLRKVMTDAEWRQEMECEFLEESDAFIPYDKILACVEDYVMSKPGQDVRTFLGVDFGRYRDSTVLIGLAAEKEKLRICFVQELKQASFDSQLQAIKRASAVLEPTVIAVDSTGMGAPLSEALQKTLPSVTPVTITAAVKESLVKNLRSHVVERKLVIPADETTLINQLRHFEQTFKNGHVKYGAPSGEHDDYVMALALAVFAASFTKPRVDAAFFWRWKSPAHFTPQNQ